MLFMFFNDNKSKNDNNNNDNDGDDDDDNNGDVGAYLKTFLFCMTPIFFKMFHL